MRTDTMVKWAMGIGALSVAGGAIALWRGAGFLGVVENVGNILILIALVAGKPIALRYPAYLQQIAFGVAVGSAGIGVWSKPLCYAVRAARKPGVTFHGHPRKRMRCAHGGCGRNFLRFCDPASRRKPVVCHSRQTPLGVHAEPCRAASQT